MRAGFANFEPRVQKLLSFVQSTLKWRLMGPSRARFIPTVVVPPRPLTTPPSSARYSRTCPRFILGSRSPSLPPRLCETITHHRLPDCTETQQSSRLEQHIFHLPGRPEQQAHDAVMRYGLAGNSNQWAGRAKNEVQFLYDADEAVGRWWEETGRMLLDSFLPRRPSGVSKSRSRLRQVFDSGCTYAINCSKIKNLSSKITFTFTSTSNTPYNLTIPLSEPSSGPLPENTSMCQTLISAYNGYRLGILGGALSKHYYSIWDVDPAQLGFVKNNF
ncbi:hypothetical protein DENSPDRAFT_881071 [Dentipellis sp. KUC8613]|nr:hypothetical protein DENSPDRAFT_881071 [Dentipellis sp. KUC8613]